MVHGIFDLKMTVSLCTRVNGFWSYARHKTGDICAVQRNYMHLLLGGKRSKTETRLHISDERTVNVQLYLRAQIELIK